MMSAAPETVTVPVAGRRVNVAIWGKSDALAVVLIHGMRDHCRSWDTVAAALSGQFRIIAPDLRGHGDSDWAGADGYSLAAYAADIADVTAALGLDEYAIVGHSLGGAIGLRVAAAFPDRVTSFVGIECVELPIQREEADVPVSYAVRLRQWLDLRQAAVKREGRFYPTPQSACERMQREQPDLPEATIGHLARHAILHEQGKGWRWKFDPWVRLRAPEDQRASDLDEVLEAITCPVLLCYGDKSWIPLPPAERLARLTNHSISLFAGGSHWLHHQFVERFAAQVRAHIEANHRMKHYA